jgi:hypothetical protein
MESEPKNYIYTRPECVFHYCANPGDCYSADACVGPVEKPMAYAVRKDGTVEVGRWPDHDTRIGD